MTKKRINIKDIVRDEFYQLPKLFFWDKRYREETSPGAKLLYMLVKDRFNLSLHTTKQENEQELSPSYIDKNGDIYCILDNQEIEFTLDTTTKTVIKWMDELISLGLVEKEESEGGANRIYLNTLDSSGADLAIFLGQRDYYKHVKSRKKKKKEPLKSEQDCIDEWIKKLSKKETPKTTRKKKEGGNNSLPRGGEIPPLGDGKSTDLGAEEIPPPGDGDCPPLGEEKVQTSNNYSSEPDLNQNDSNLNNGNNNESSSNNMSDTNDLEEEELTFSSDISVFGNYKLLPKVPGISEVCPDQRAINVVNKTLMEAKIDSLKVGDVIKALASHPKNIRNYLEKGEKIRYEPAFFANNLVDTIRYRKANEKLNHNNFKETNSNTTSGRPDYDYLNN